MESTPEAYHTQDEALRGIDFYSSVGSVGVLGDELNEALPRPLTKEEREQPFEVDGFGD